MPFGVCMQSEVLRTVGDLFPGIGRGCAFLPLVESFLGFALILFLLSFSSDILSTVLLQQFQ